MGSYEHYVPSITRGDSKGKMRQVMEIVWKVCKTCEGKGFTKPSGEPLEPLDRLKFQPVACVECGGKGLEVNKIVDTDREEV